MPGSDLSHPARVTMASKLSACMTHSTESAMTSRETSEARMPSWPIEMPSETAIVTNSKGTPPASRTATLVRLASRSSGRLQGVTSFQLDATPIWGLDMSSSERPMARSIARAGARLLPRVTSVLRGVGWIVIYEVYEATLPLDNEGLRTRGDRDRLAGRQQFDPRLSRSQVDDLARRRTIRRLQTDVAT